MSAPLRWQSLPAAPGFEMWSAEYWGRTLVVSRDRVTCQCTASLKRPGGAPTFLGEFSNIRAAKAAAELAKTRQ